MKISNKEIEALIYISKSVGQYPDFVQGGGGNTSVKSHGGEMCIKASGYELKELSGTNGFTVVNGKAIAEYFRNIQISDPLAQEKASITFIQNNLTDPKGLRPSMETGFHSLLDTYVIHTHSVYANIVNCAFGGEEILKNIFKEEDIKPLFVEYCNPGFELSAQLDQKIKTYKNDFGENPKAFFLQNHGLIISSSDQEEAILLHQQVNDVLKKYLRIENPYPEIALKQIAENVYESISMYLSEKIKQYNPGHSFFERILFPDQTVFFNNNFSISGKNEQVEKININTTSHKIIYCASYKEATTLEETLTAFFYILEQMEKNKYSPLFINQPDIDRINNMESEKHRKDLLR